MTICPVCKKKNIYGEQVTRDDFILRLTYYDCPVCGAYRMNLEAESISWSLSDEEVQGLQFWIQEKNANCAIPVINFNLLSAFLFPKRSENGLLNSIS